VVVSYVGGSAFFYRPTEPASVKIRPAQTDPLPALALSPGTAEETVGIRGLIRVSARTPAELNTAGEQVRERATECGVTLSPLNGQQAVAVTATLPVGGAA